MPAATAIEFFEAFPIDSHFRRFDATDVDRWLQEIEAIYCPASVWTEPFRQRRAVIMRLAHELESQLQAAAANASMGAAISKGQTFTPNFGNNPLDRTVYGQEFAALRQNLPTTTGFAF